MLPESDPRGEIPYPTNDLLQLTYDELRILARSKLARERPGHTLQPTALVHEVWLRLSTQQGQLWANRRHFFVAAAEAMRRILIENARRRDSLRRGGDLRRTEFLDDTIPSEALSEAVLDLDAALVEFQKIEPLKAELVRLRFYAGMTLEDAADILGVSPATAKRHWRYSKAWLHRHISTGSAGIPAADKPFFRAAAHGEMD